MQQRSSPWRLVRVLVVLIVGTWSVLAPAVEAQMALQEQLASCRARHDASCSWRANPGNRRPALPGPAIGVPGEDGVYRDAEGANGLGVHVNEVVVEAEEMGAFENHNLCNVRALLSQPSGAWRHLSGARGPHSVV